ncbi:MAG: DUF1461 domain-containing protein [Actinomycetota bacterium]|nr:DUF1461 domain-containing protein [Actinomycetota bacterium]
MKNPAVQKTLMALAAITLVVIILLAPLSFYLYNENNYMQLYRQNGVTSRLNLNDLEYITQNLIEFFQNRAKIEVYDPQGETGPFTLDEISHLEDVRILINWLLFAFYLSLALFIITIILLLHKPWVIFARSIGIILLSGACLILILLALLLLFSQNFVVLFENFHQVFFPQGNYIFPEDSLLITLFPLGFFNQYFFKLLSASGFLWLIALGGGIILINSERIGRLWKKKAVS